MRNASNPICCLAIMAITLGTAADDLWEGPIPRPSADAGIGRLVPDLEVRSTTGEPVSLVPKNGEQATVIALTSITCPLTRKFAPLIGRMSRELESKDVRWIFIDATGSDTAEEFESFARQSGFTGDLVHDPTLRVAWALGCSSTTESLLVDERSTIRYRGCVDDRYGIGYALDDARRTPLLDALSSVLEGRAVELQATTAPGCELGRDESVPGEDTPTYHGSISRILQANCTNCHRADGPGPFSLTSYEEVAANARMIKRVVERRTMPPWFAGDGSHASYGRFSNDRSLPELEIRTLVSWVDNGRPRGEPSTAPLEIAAAESWSIGAPDHVIRLPEPVEIKAEGQMPYVDITVDPGLDEDLWIRGWEVLPTDRSVLHHALIFAVPPGERGRFGPTDGFLAAYVPGNGHVLYPDGQAKKLPAGSRIHFQIHYTPNGVASTDQLALGLVVADEPPTEEVHTIGIADTRLRIPAGAANHVEGTSLRLPADVRVLSMTPHMHIRGAAFNSTATDPEGNVTTLLDVPRYDFNWQLRYTYADPPLLAKGTTVEISGTFDNSTGNPGNPDPTQRVRWGKQTDDEMLIGYVEYLIAGDQSEAVVRDASDRTVFGEQGERLIARWDKDGDGRVSLEEMPKERRAQFMLVDLDSDGFVDVDEFIEAAMRLTR